MIWCVALPLVAYRWHIVTPVALLLNILLWFPHGHVRCCPGFGVLVLRVGRCRHWEPSVVDVATSISDCWKTVRGLGDATCQVVTPGSAAPPLGGNPDLLRRAAGGDRDSPAGECATCGASPAPTPLMFVTSTVVPFGWGLRSVLHPTLQCSFLAVGHGTCVVLGVAGRDRWVCMDAGGPW